MRILKTVLIAGLVAKGMQVAASEEVIDLTKGVASVQIVQEKTPEQEISMHDLIRMPEKDALAALRTSQIDLNRRYSVVYLGNHVIRRDNGNILHFAVIQGQLDLVRCLIEEKGMDINELASGRYNILHLAVMSGRLSVVKYLVETKKMDIKSLTSVNTGSKLITVGILNLAAMYGKLDIVKYFLNEKGMDIDALEGGWNLLQVAVTFGRVDIVKYLVETKKMDIKVRTREGKTLMEIASDPEILNKPKMTDIFKFLQSLEKGAGAALPSQSSNSSADASSSQSNKEVFTQVLSRLNDRKSAFADLLIALEGNNNAKDALARVFSDLLSGSNRSVSEEAEKSSSKRQRNF